ncbi:MAG: LemA family protein [Eubacteriales bacterium]
MVGYIVLGVVIVVVIIIVIWYIAAYNSFITMKNKIEEAFATIDVYLKKRFDLVPNLVETVKGYAAHERQTLDEVIAARNSVASSSTTEERLQNENILSGTLRSLFAVSEAYPNLKANENFMDLQKQLQQIENDIANARKYYNANVRMFNTKLLTFPTNIIANQFKFTKQPMFEAAETDRQNVQVKF